MTFIKLNPVSEIQRLNRLFENLKNFADYQTDEENLLKVKADIFEDEHNLQIVMELPGIAKEDITISMDNDRKLTIKGEKKHPNDYEKRTIVRCET